MKSIFGGNSGYVGYSESVRSLEAKNEGKFPKTIFKKEFHISEKMFNYLIDRDVISSCGWHHTSKFGNRTTFYEIDNKILFYMITGDKKQAFELYKKTRNYSATIRKTHNPNNSQDFLNKCSDFAQANNFFTGTVFEFKGQQIIVISRTKHLKRPVCQFKK